MVGKLLRVLFAVQASHHDGRHRASYGVSDRLRSGQQLVGDWPHAAGPEFRDDPYLVGCRLARSLRSELEIAARLAALGLEGPARL